MNPSKSAPSSARAALTRKDIVLLALVFCAGIGVDQLTKSWALGRVPVYENAGVMAGMLADLPPLLKTVSISTVGAFLVFAYGFLQLLIPVRTRALRFGLTLYLAAILGNLIDRVLRGAIIDFLVLRLPVGAAAFNVADFLQWAGAVLILYALIRDNVDLWPMNNHRVRYTVIPRYQVRYGVIFTGAVGLCLLIAGVFSYTFLRSTLIDSVGVESALARKILLIFALLFVLIVALCLLSVFLLAKVISNRTAGPVFALTRFVRQLASGELDPKTARFKVRKNDDFLELEELGNAIAKTLARKD